MALLLPSAVGVALARRPMARVAPAALAAFALGLTSAQVATWRAPPLILLPTHAVTLTGMVRGVDPLPEGRRLLLEAVHLDGAEAALPRLVRVRLRAGDPAVVATGDTVRIRALLRTPASPAYHGGWDLQRDAFFSGLGGSGFALGPAERIAAADPAGLARRLQLLRERVGARFIKGIPGAAGRSPRHCSPAWPEPFRQPIIRRFTTPGWRICWRWLDCISASSWVGRCS